MWVTSFIALVIFVGFWMFIGLLACAVLLKVFSMAMGITGMELWDMIVSWWISRVNNWSDNGKD
jgi:hypothetical protein